MEKENNTKGQFYMNKHNRTKVTITGQLRIWLSITCHMKSCYPISTSASRQSDNYTPGRVLPNTKDADTNILFIIQVGNIL